MNQSKKKKNTKKKLPAINIRVLAFPSRRNAIFQNNNYRQSPSHHDGVDITHTHTITQTQTKIMYTLPTEFQSTFQSRKK